MERGENFTLKLTLKLTRNSVITFSGCLTEKYISYLWVTGATKSKVYGKKRNFTHTRIFSD